MVFLDQKSSTLDYIFQNHQTNCSVSDKFPSSSSSTSTKFLHFSHGSTTIFPVERAPPPADPLDSPPAAAPARSPCGPGHPRPGWKRSGCRCCAPRRRRSRAPTKRGEATGRSLGLYENFWLVVGPPLWKIWKSVGMMRFPILMGK